MSYRKGFISFMAIAIILILILSALKINLRGYLEASPEEALTSNFVLIVQTGKVIWSDYIRAPLVILWDKYLQPSIHNFQ